MAPSLKFCLKLAVSGGLILYLALTLDWVSIGRAMQGMGMGFYLLSVAMTLLSTCFMAWKCMLLIEKSPIRCSFWELVKINIMARFYALFLPPALGPEMVRWYKITRDGPGKTFFMAGTLFERAGFVLVSLLVSALFLYLSPFSREIAALRDRMLPLLAVMVLGTILAQGFFLSTTLHQAGGRILSRLLPAMRIKQRLLDLYDQFFLSNRSVRLVAGMTVLSIGWQVFFLLRMYLLFLALSIPLGWVDVVWMSSSIFLLQMLPVSLAGIGLREGAYTYVFALIGLPPEQGAAVGLLFFSQFLLMAGLGGLLELADFRRKRMERE